MSIRDRILPSRSKSCFICQQPITSGDAVELRGEPVHRDCARAFQQAGRVVRNGGDQS